MIDATNDARDGRGHAPPRTRKFARSGQMIDCLRSELLYSEKRARDFIFTATEQLLGDGRAPMIVSRLTRDASVLARALATEAGFEFTNWHTVGKATLRAMLAAGALLTPAGDPIPPGVKAQAMEVAALRDGFRDLTESFLLEFLIARLGDVTVRDHTALAHVLFRQFDPSVSMHDQEDRIAILLAGMSDRVELLGQTYSLRGGRS